MSSQPSNHKQVTNVLITRDIEPDHYLINKLASQNIQLDGVSFVAFEAVHFQEIPQTDWIFFYSKNGVKYFFTQPNDNELLKNVKLAAIGKATADALLLMGRTADFVGEGQPDQVAKEFLQLAKRQSVLFPRAVNSNNSIRKQIEEACNCYDLIVYKNNIKPQLITKQYEIIVFTSPLNVEGFLSSNQIKQESKLISIGPSTTEKLKEFNFTKVIESPTPEMASLIKLLQS